MLFKKTEEKLFIKVICERIFKLIIPLVDKLPLIINKGGRRRRERRTTTERSGTTDYIRVFRVATT
jgi:hypothetical protein